MREGEGEKRAKKRRRKKEKNDREEKEIGVCHKICKHFNFCCVLNISYFLYLYKFSRIILYSFILEGFMKYFH